MQFGDFFRNKRILITGHTGFKGGWLTTWLLELGAKVYGVSKDVPTHPSIFEALKLRDKISHFQIDIRDLDAMKTIVRQIQPEFVFHLAAQPIVATAYQAPIETITTNIVGTANLLESLRLLENNCCAVMITSDKCYDNVEWPWGYRETDRLGGRDPYSASKGGAELMIRTYFHSYFANAESKVRLISVRAGNVVGGGDWAISRIVPDCIRAWESGNPVNLRNPQATRPWQHVLEPLSGYLRGAQVLAGTPSIHGEAYNFGPATDQNFTVHELLEKLSCFWRHKNLSDFFILDTSNTFHEAGLLKLNCDKALSQLDWRSVLDFEQTAIYTAEWYYQYYSNQGKDLYSFTAGQIGNYTENAVNKGLKWTQ